MITFDILMGSQFFKDFFVVVHKTHLLIICFRKKMYYTWRIRATILTINYFSIYLKTHSMLRFCVDHIDWSLHTNKNSS